MTWIAVEAPEKSRLQVVVMDTAFAIAKFSKVCTVILFSQVAVGITAAIISIDVCDLLDSDYVLVFQLTWTWLVEL